MPLLIFFMLLFILLGMLWVIGAVLLVATVFSGGPSRVMDRLTDYKGRHCTCHFPFKHPA